MHRELPEGKRLYVGNLPFGLDERELRKTLAQHVGVENVELMKHRRTGESRGFAFVELISMSDAPAAITNFHNAELQGRVIKVEIAKPRGRRDECRVRNQRRNGHSVGRPSER